MTPGARIAAAIEILHDMSEGLAAEQALTRWARRSRFAGSKDRAAIRDHIFGVLRRRSLAAHYGKADRPRALMIGALYHEQADLEALFSGEGHAPAPLSPAEQVFPDAPDDKETLWNLPAWLVSHFEKALGANAQTTALALQDRAPVSLRVNTAKTTVADAQEMLTQAGIETTLNALCETALLVTEGARKIRNSAAYQEGLIELQDAASQAVAAAAPTKVERVLDYCAGGGGKTLAMAVDPSTAVYAHDIDPRRMADLPARAGRAGVDVTLVATEDLTQVAPFDTVLCDAPCSGSGAWRRSPEAKWTLNEARLAELARLQDQILDNAAAVTSSNGTLVYATCSVLRCENEDRISAFLERQGQWFQTFARRFEVTEQGDGFFTAHLKRND